MNPAKVYYTDLRTRDGDNLPKKLQRLIRAAGIADIDMEKKFVAIKLHFGEPGNLSFLRPNYAKAVADVVKELGGIPFLTDCNTLYVGRRKHALEHLEAAQDRFLLPEPAPNSNPSWFGFLLTCREGLERNALVQRIEAAGVQTRMLFSGNILRQPCMSDVAPSSYRVVGDLSNSDRIVTDTFWVGVYPGMSDEMIDDMAQIILHESARG